MAEGYRIWLDRISTSYGTQPRIPGGMMMESSRWELQNEIGILRASKTSYKKSILVWPKTIQYVPDYNHYLILDDVGDDQCRVYILSDSSLLELQVRGLLSSSTFVRHIYNIDKETHLIVSSDFPQEISITDYSGQIVRHIWTYSDEIPIHQPSFAIPYYNGFLVLDEKRYKYGHYLPAGIWYISLSGRIIWEWHPSDKEQRLEIPTHILALPDGRFVVTDYGRHQVLCMDSPGDIRWIYGRYREPGSQDNQLSSPLTTSLTPSGSLLVADSRNNRLVELTLNGELKRYIEGKTDEYGVSISSIYIPGSAIHASDSQDILIADSGNHRIAVWNNNSIYTLIGEEFPARHLLSFPRSVQAFSQNSWIVSDTYNNRIIILDSNNQVTWQYGNKVPKSGSKLNLPRCARIFQGNLIYIADSLNGRIICTDMCGNIHSEISRFTIEGMDIDLKDPHDVLPTAQNTILVVDSELRMVFEIDSKGKVIWWSKKLYDADLLRNPHQVAKLEKHTLAVVDPEVGLILIDRQKDTYKLVTEVPLDNQNNKLYLDYPRALIKSGKRTIIMERHSLLVLDSTMSYAERVYKLSSAGVDLPSLITYDFTYKFNCARWLDNMPGNRLIVSDCDASRLIIIGQVEYKHNCGNLPRRNTHSEVNLSVPHQ